MARGGNGNKPPRISLEVHVGQVDVDDHTEIHVIDHDTKKVFVRIAIPSETVAYVNPSGGPLKADRFRSLRDLLSLCFTAVIDSMTDSISS